MKCRLQCYTCGLEKLIDFPSCETFAECNKQFDTLRKEKLLEHKCGGHFALERNESHGKGVVRQNTTNNV